MASFAFLLILFILLTLSIGQILVDPSKIADFERLFCALAAAASVECVPVCAHLEICIGNLTKDILSVAYVGRGRLEGNFLSSV